MDDFMKGQQQGHVVLPLVIHCRRGFDYSFPYALHEQPHRYDMHSSSPLSATR